MDTRIADALILGGVALIYIIINLVRSGAKSVETQVATKAAKQATEVDTENIQNQALGFVMKAANEAWNKVFELQNKILELQKLYYESQIKEKEYLIRLEEQSKRISQLEMIVGSLQERIKEMSDGKPGNSGTS